MERFERKRAVSGFAVDLLSECLDSTRDVIARCSDGEVLFNRYFLGLLSPVLYRIFNDCLYNSLPQISILLPDFTKHEVKKLKKLVSQDESLNPKSGLSDALALMRPLEKRSKIVSPISRKTAGKGVSSYYETIPDISNLDSLDLFDPMYLEDIEIQNEENLSLTIHSADVELMTPTLKKSKSKKPKHSPKPKSRKKDDRTEMNGDRKTLHEVPAPCSGCGERLETKLLMEKHKKDCSTNNIICSICDKSFRTETQLSAHTEKVHSDEPRSLSCQFCNKSFKKIFQLQNHLRVHSGERPFICHTCGKAFNQEATLRTHLRIHTGMKPHVCGDCGESFITGNSLLSHKQWKHTDGSRPFLCSFCSKSFPTKGAVKKHETIHKTEKRHSCDLCDKVFARSDHLKSHVRSHQNYDKPKIKLDEDVKYKITASGKTV